MQKIKNVFSIAQNVRKWGTVVIALATWVGSCMESFPADAFKELSNSQ